MTTTQPISWQTALQHYHVWNNIEYQHRNQGQDGVKKWQQFLALMEFGLQIKPEPSLYEQQQKVNVLNSYYQQIEQFEYRKRQHGQSN